MRFNAFTNIAFQCNFHFESFVLWQGQNCVAHIHFKMCAHIRREWKFVANFFFALIESNMYSIYDDFICLEKELGWIYAWKDTHKSMMASRWCKLLWMPSYFSLKWQYDAWNITQFFGSDMLRCALKLDMKKVFSPSSFFIIIWNYCWMTRC